jgi:TolA-binding protein
MSTPPKKLAQGQSAVSRLLEAAERESAPPAGARERVWRRLTSAREKRRPAPFLAGFAFAAVAAAAALLLWPRPPVLATLAERSGAVEVSGASGTALPAGARVSVGEGKARLLLPEASIALAAETRVEVPRERTLRLSQGEVSVVTRGILTIAAGAYRVEAVTAAFLVQVETRGVTLTVHQGTVHVGDADVSAGQTWSSIPPEPPPARRTGPAPAEAPGAEPPAPPKVEPPPPRKWVVARVEQPVPAPEPAPQSLAPPPETDDVLHGRAEAAEAQGSYGEAAALYAELSQRPGPRAGTSLYELARVRRRFLGQPQEAIDALDDYRRRFPDGALALEASLSALEARLALGQDEAALREMDAFLARWPASERAAEVRWLRASLLAGKGDCAGVLADLQALAAQGPRADDASFVLASCIRRGGNVEAARAQLEDYLRRFPQGRHAAEAARALGREAP